MPDAPQEPSVEARDVAAYIVRGVKDARPKVTGRAWVDQAIAKKWQALPSLPPEFEHALAARIDAMTPQIPVTMRLEWYQRVANMHQDAGATVGLTREQVVACLATRDSREYAGTLDNTPSALIAEMAANAGVHEDTVHRWLEESASLSREINETYGNGRVIEFTHGVPPVLKDAARDTRLDPASLYRRIPVDCAIELMPGKRWAAVVTHGGAVQDVIVDQRQALANEVTRRHLAEHHRTPPPIGGNSPQSPQRPGRPTPPFSPRLPGE